MHTAGDWAIFLMSLLRAAISQLTKALAKDLLKDCFAKALWVFKNVFLTLPPPHHSQCWQMNYLAETLPSVLVLSRIERETVLIFYLEMHIYAMPI